MSEGASTPLRKEFTPPPKLVHLGSFRALTMGRTGSQTDGASGMAQAMMSDARAKKNIVKIGRHPSGFGLYLFSYKPAYQRRFGSGRQLGVLTAEVEAIAGDRFRGWRRLEAPVDYGGLGVFAPVA